jgi:hypothetical protein
MKFTVVVAIVPYDLEDTAIDHAQRAGATGVTILTGKGLSAQPRRTFFGLTYEGTQSVLLMVVGAHLATPVLKALGALLVQDKDSRGLAFSVPIEHLTGIDLAQVTRFEEHLRREEG